MASADVNDAEINDALQQVLGIVEMEQERSYLSNAEIFDQLLAAYSSQMNTYATPTGVASDYVGVHLGKVYEDSDMDDLLKSFKNNQVLDAFYVLKLISDAKFVMQKMPNIRECLVVDPTDRGVVIVGDLHGSFNDLNNIIYKFGIPGRKYSFVFNGDFVDRGDKQIETLIILLYSFLLRPSRVFLNRGNHEDSSMNMSSHFHPNFLSDVRSKYGPYATAIFNAANDFFAYLPLATIIKNRLQSVKFFVVHGGIFDKIDLNYVQTQVNRASFQRITSRSNDPKAGEQVSNMLWSDPIRVGPNGKLEPYGAKQETGCFFNKNRNAGSCFGYDITKNFCQQYNYKAIIRSHEVRDRGWSEDHPQCYTVFSASLYCGGKNLGAVFVHNSDSTTLQPHEYQSFGGDVSSQTAKNTHALMKQFKKIIQSRQVEIYRLFRQHDPGNLGFLPTGEWAQVLSQYFKNQISPRHLIAVKDLICQCDDITERAYYRSMFRTTSGGGLDQRDPQYYNMVNTIRNLFEVIDVNRDGRISSSEAQDAVRLIN